MTDIPTDPPPRPPDDGAETDEFAALDAREALFTHRLEQAERAANRAAAYLRRTMLEGWSTMVAEEEAEGRTVQPDGIVARAFSLHQATVLRLPRQVVMRQLTVGWTLRDSLPATWAVFGDGLCSEQAASIAADESGGLRGEKLVAFDLVAAQLVQQEKPGTLARKLAALRDRLDPEASIGRHAEASNRRHVTVRPRGDGQGSLIIDTDATDVAAAYDVVRQAAIKAHARDGECRTLGQLMADIAVDLILRGAAVDAPEPADPAYPMERLGDIRVPGRKAVTASLLVVMTAETATGASNDAAELAGMGPIDADVARHLVQHTTSWTRVVTDPIDQAVLGIDSRDRFIPSGLKKLIHVRTPSCAGDDCGLPAHRADLDHITCVEHDGRTRHTNLQPLCRPSHRMKDEGGHWKVTSGDDGSTIWRSRWGAVRIMRPSLRIRTNGAPPTADDYPF
ncbi:MAG: hypothetical protein ACTHJL_14205 [Amnibacterium sp.]